MLNQQQPTRSFQSPKLPEVEQDAFAAIVLEELDSERRWDEALARSQDKLAQLASQALAEHRRLWLSIAPVVSVLIVVLLRAAWLRGVGLNQ